MREWQSHSHVRWYGKYHVVWVPKYRKRVIFGQVRRGIGRIVRELCQRHGVELIEGHALSDHANHSVGHPTEVQRGEHGGVSEREVSDPHSSGVSGAAAQFHGLPLLGAWVLRQHGWFGRRGHPRLHPETGSRREETREAGTWLNRRPLRGAFIIPPPQGAVADFQVGAVARYGSGTPSEPHHDEGPATFGYLPDHWTFDLNARVHVWSQGDRRVAVEFDATNLTDNVYAIAKGSEATPLQYAMRRVISGRLRVSF